MPALTPLPDPAPGWHRIGPSPGIAAWATAALPLARAAIAASPDPWRAGGTWFVGVDALPNDDSGAIGGVPLPADLVACLPWLPQSWHRAQVSTIRPGYPRPEPGETAAATRFRALRDAAHVDGLLPIGPDRRRMLREPHAFILGLPLTACSTGAAPLVVWEGSQTLMLQAFRAALAPHPPALWPDIDLTDAYHAARRAAFDACRRVELPARPGEALLLHRAILHGTSPWAEGAAAPADGRMIAFLRPEVDGIADWLTDPGNTA